MPPTEIYLWSKLKYSQLNGLKFRRQYGVGPYVIDFYCPKLKLAIEVDGPSHSKPESIKYDRERQLAIESLGIRFLHLTNLEVDGDIDGALNKIWATALTIMNKK